MKNQFAIIHNTLADSFNSTTAGKMKSSLPTRNEFNEALIANGKKDSLIDVLAQAAVSAEKYLCDENRAADDLLPVIEALQAAIQQAKDMGAL